MQTCTETVWHPHRSTKLQGNTLYLQVLSSLAVLLSEKIQSSKQQHLASKFLLTGFAHKDWAWFLFPYFSVSDLRFSLQLKYINWWKCWARSWILPQQMATGVSRLNAANWTQNFSSFLVFSSFQSWVLCSIWRREAPKVSKMCRNPPMPRKALWGECKIGVEGQSWNGLYCTNVNCCKACFYFQMLWITRKSFILQPYFKTYSVQTDTSERYSESIQLSFLYAPRFPLLMHLNWRHSPGPTSLCINTCIFHIAH